MLFYSGNPRKKKERKNLVLLIIAKIKQPIRIKKPAERNT